MMTLAAMLLSSWGCRHPTHAMAPMCDSEPASAAVSTGERESSELIVAVHDGRDPAEVARRHQLILKRTLVSDPNMAVLDAGSIDTARKAKTALSKDPAVRAVYFNPPTLNVPFSKP